MISQVNRHLGRKSPNISQYDKSLLVRDPRKVNRDPLKIDSEKLPFIGYDIWNAYEVSCLTTTGLPVTGLAKIVYPCDNKFIVESKSLKLYLNSFNMTKLAKTASDCRNIIQNKVSKDLSELLETNVEVGIFNPNNLNIINDGYYSAYRTIEEHLDNDILDCNSYQENKELLKVDIREYKQFKLEEWHTSLLRSNCRETFQPDFGDVYISMSGKKHPSKESLLSYIVSFRDERHFHESICETIYERLWSIFSPKELTVTCFYTQRGGININPTRASHEYLLDTTLIDVQEPYINTTRQ